MSRSEPIGVVPAETAWVAHLAFPSGAPAMRLRDEFGSLYRDENFRALYSTLGQTGLAPWRLALVTVFQFLEHLSDRQAHPDGSSSAPRQAERVCQEWYRNIRRPSRFG